MHPVHWNSARVEEELKQRRVAYRRGSLLHGRQFVVASGEVVNVYPDGSVVVAGPNTALSSMLHEVFGSQSGQGRQPALRT